MFDQKAYMRVYGKSWRAKNKEKRKLQAAIYNALPEVKARAEAVRAKRYAANPGKKARERKTAADNRRSKFNALMERIKSGPSTDCGGRFPVCAMDFDHCRGEKKFEVSRGLDKPSAAVTEEIANCDLVCAVCHRVRTAKRIAEKRRNALLA
jgi:hypothetical protein